MHYLQTNYVVFIVIYLDYMSVLKYFMCCTSLLSLQRSIHFPNVGDYISPNHFSNVHHIDCMIIFTTVTYTLVRHLQIHINLKILHQAGIELVCFLLL